MIGMEISHEEFNIILKETNKYEEMKENVRRVSEKEENMRFNSVNSRTKKIMKLLLIYTSGDL